jgi:hypothetical protein
VTREDCERWLDAMAVANGLAIDPAWREGVLANLARIVEQHERLAGFDFASSPVPAPRFEP